jgi:hypothetical protein
MRSMGKTVPLLVVPNISAWGAFTHAAVFIHQINDEFIPSLGLADVLVKRI